MKKIEFENTKETLMIERLENGFTIYMLPMESRFNTYVTLTTKFGSVDTSFVPFDKNKMENFPSGIAHFLEHMAFASDSEEDPFEFFSKKGVNANANTSFFRTVYEIYGSADMCECAVYMLDFVLSPYFNDEIIEKEKGIISEEINHYEDDSNWQEYKGVFKNAFNTHPIKNSILGSLSDINTITSENLYDCFNTFYNPSNMFMVITGSFKWEEMISKIKEYFKDKSYSKNNKIKVNDYKEDDKVANKYECICMPIITTKLSYNFKIPTDNFKVDQRKLDYYFAIIFSSLFGETSLFLENMRNQKYVIGDITVENESTPSHALVSLSCDTYNKDRLIESIDKYIKKINVSKEEFERKKKTIMNMTVSSFDNIIAANDYIKEGIIKYGNVETNMTSFMASMTHKELLEIIDKLNLDNKTIFVTEKE